LRPIIEKFESLLPEYKPATELLTRTRGVASLDGFSTATIRTFDSGIFPEKWIRGIAETVSFMIDCWVHGPVVQRLARCPFKAEMRVRFPPGLPAPTIFLPFRLIQV